MRLRQLLEYRELVDLRHPNTLDTLKYWPAKEDPDYISPEDGFHFQYDMESYNPEKAGTLFIYSVENVVYSAHALGKPKIKVPWNVLGGKVDLTARTVTVAKENYSIGIKSLYRQRVIANIKGFKKMLNALKRHGVTDDFIVKGVSGLPKTVGEILKISDPTDTVLSGRSITTYHGTSISRWETIQRVGLKPGQTGSAYVDLIPDYSERNVYLATTAKTAEFYGKRQAEKDGDQQYVILQVVLPDPARVMSDDAYAVLGGEIKPADPGGLRRSGRHLGEFAYRGRIPASFIKLLSTRKFVGRRA